MNEELESVKESAKAVQEVAKTTGKAIDVSQKAGKFIAKYIAGPLEQGIGIFEDKLKYMRWERQTRFMRRADELMKKLDLDGPTKPIQMKIAIPLFQAASLEDDDYLQDRWANLLVNASNAQSEIEVLPAYVHILSELSSEEARILDAIEKKSKPVKPLGLSKFGPRYPMLPAIDLQTLKKIDRLEEVKFQICLGNLQRMGLIQRVSGGGMIHAGRPIGVLPRGILPKEMIGLTPLGSALVSSCEEPLKKHNN